MGRMLWRGWVVAGTGAAALLLLTGCGARRPAIDASPGATQSGVASWYGPRFHGRQTASGEIYDQYAMTAAHQTLPHGTRVRVVNLGNQREVIVRINDRGPFVDDRVIDLSYSAARQLDMIGPGTAPVRVEVLDPDVALSSPPPIVERPVIAAPPPARRSTAARPVAATTDVAPAPPRGANRAYRVQVGTWADYERARRAQQSLGGVGRAHLALIETAGARYYQVRLGPFADQADAAAAARRIVDLGFPALVIAQ